MFSIMPRALVFFATAQLLLRFRTYYMRENL
jgi:hypothetical protein